MILRNGRDEKMTLKEAYDYGVEQLQKSEIMDAKQDSFTLLEHVTRMNRGKYYAMNQKEMGQEEQREYIALIRKRCMRIPLQHLMGTTEFMGLPFKINPHVLIPRQDTELLVETALGWIKESLRSDREKHEFKGESSQKRSKVVNQIGVEKEEVAEEKAGKEECRILDMCTGSGCILISILHYVTKDFPKIKGVGVDISPEALEIAKENAQKNGLNVARSMESQMVFIESDLFAQLNPEEKYHMIVSNPPYIPTKEIEGLEEEVRSYDPILALDGREDGLYFYRRIIEQSPDYLTEEGVLMVECGWNQGEEVSQLMRESGFGQVKVIKDYHGLDRVVVANKAMNS